METKDNFKKLCSFYVSDIHFGTMILPYISKRLEEEKSIHTIFENDMNKSIEQVVSKLNLKQDVKEEIKNIDWNKKVNKNELKEQINKINDNKEVVLVAGSKKYIDKANKRLKKHFKKENFTNMIIINCYNIDVFNKNLEEILKSHNGVLNTGGERKIEV